MKGRSSHASRKNRNRKEIKVSVCDIGFEAGLKKETGTSLYSIQLDHYNSCSDAEMLAFCVRE
jgi:hypothetical protein